MKETNLTNSTRSLEKPLRVNLCESYFCRLLGLMFRNALNPEEGLLLVQRRENRRDSSIHMLFVGMDLGVIWLNTSLVVVDKVRAKSWKPYYAPEKPARYILEIHPDRLDEFKLGDQIHIEEDRPG
jgi:uncharacterized membrane protein (UPF0127 family)